MLDISVALSILALCLWFLWRRSLFTVIEKMGIPGPKPNIFFGNLLELYTLTPLVCQKQWLDKYGDVVGYYLGTQPMLLVTNVEIMKKIQISDFPKFINRPIPSNDVFKGALTTRLSRSRDKRWKKIRSILTQSFSTGKIKQMIPSIKKAVDIFVENLDKIAKTSQPFNIHKMYRGLTMDVIGRTAFGIQTDCQNNPNKSFLRSIKVLLESDSSTGVLQILSLSFPELAPIVCFLSRMKLRYINSGVDPMTEIVDYTNEVIKARRETPSTRRQDLLQLMIDTQISESSSKSLNVTAGEEDSKESFETETLPEQTSEIHKSMLRMSDNEIVDNAVLFFLAGYRTTSTALAFTTHFLIHYPEVQERVRKEVLGLIVKEGRLDYTSLHELQYLDQVVKESLRMYPPLYYIVHREASEDIDIGKYRFLKGITVQFPTYAIQHDERYWKDPEQFDPDRFSPENKKPNNSIAFQAFGGGPRNCVGMRLAQMEIKLALAQTLSKYKLVKCEETDKLDITLQITPIGLRPAKGIFLRAIPL